MKFCRECGAQVSDDAAFCRNCGYKFAQEASTENVPDETVAHEQPVDVAQSSDEQVLEAPVAQEEQTIFEETPTEQYEQQPDEPLVAPQEPLAPIAEPDKKQEKTIITRDKRQTLSVGQYFWLMVLFLIPVIGLVFLFVWGCGNPKNNGLKRFSLACLILRLIFWIVVIAVAVVAIILFHDKFDAIMNAICQFISDIGAIFGI
ncbi:MAG: zinc-ribbon domain-containing protein [Eubacteriales bacterium]|nr:zinc-ribbon domain-containing protein [Eubacteriales bacterium]